MMTESMTPPPATLPPFSWSESVKALEQKRSEERSRPRAFQDETVPEQRRREKRRRNSDQESLWVAAEEDIRPSEAMTQIVGEREKALDGVERAWRQITNRAKLSSVAVLSLHRLIGQVQRLDREYLEAVAEVRARHIETKKQAPLASAPTKIAQAEDWFAATIAEISRKREQSRCVPAKKDRRRKARHYRKVGASRLKAEQIVMKPGAAARLITALAMRQINAADYAWAMERLKRPAQPKEYRPQPLAKLRTVIPPKKKQKEQKNNEKGKKKDKKRA